MKKSQVEKIIEDALAELFEKDALLFQINANERSISHRFAIYLEKGFKGWNVDCEYNRDRDLPKRLQLEQRNVRDDDLDAITVFPDIIVHHRHTDKNLVVIEMKKSNNRNDLEYDRRKLHAFRREFGYQYAVFICVVVGNSPSIQLLEYI